MRKTFNNARKIIEFRLKEEKQREIDSRADMKRFEYKSDDYIKASIMFESSLYYQSCLENLLKYDLSDFNMKYFEEINEHKNKFTD